VTADSYPSVPPRCAASSGKRRCSHWICKNPCAAKEARP
jgi:hypothetical protein